jgi:hypothetical protein
MRSMLLQTILQLTRLRFRQSRRVKRQKRRLIKISSVLLIVGLTLTLAGLAFAAPNLSTDSKALTSGRAIARWPSDIALPGLSVSGINIVANGQPVRLRGVNMCDLFWARNPNWYLYYSTADYATLARDWSANVVRISILPMQWKNMDHAELLAGLAREVNAVLDSGRYVIISYHVIG